MGKNGETAGGGKRGGERKVRRWSRKGRRWRREVEREVERESVKWEGDSEELEMSEFARYQKERSLQPGQTGSKRLGWVGKRDNLQHVNGG